DTNKELLNYVAVIGFYGLPLDYLDTFQHNIEQVTVDSIKQAFKDRIDLNVLQTVTVGGEGARAK
ncbi:MAG: peptidase M16, partial [Methylobacter sp.]